MSLESNRRFITVMLMPEKADTGYAMLATEELLKSIQMIVACVLVPSSLAFESWASLAEILHKLVYHFVYVMLVSADLDSI
jgi:hypothetical protein